MAMKQGGVLEVNSFTGVLAENFGNCVPDTTLQFILRGITVGEGLRVKLLDFGDSLIEPHYSALDFDRRKFLGYKLRRL
jgi:hypothetical protein